MTREKPNPRQASHIVTLEQDDNLKCSYHKVNPISHVMQILPCETNIQQASDSIWSILHDGVVVM